MTGKWGENEDAEKLLQPDDDGDCRTKYQKNFISKES